MDQVVVTTIVNCWDDAGNLIEPPVLHCTSTVPGTGESKPWRWATDALVQAIESL
jgi:hypothetical protein